MKDKNRNKREEEIQNIVFNKDNANHKELHASEDIALYQMLNTNLEEEPDFSLDMNFAEIATKKAVERKKRHSLFKTIATYFSIMLLTVVTGGLAFYFIDKENYIEITHLLSNYGFQVAFFMLLLIGIQIIDKLLLKKANTELEVLD